MTSNTSAIQWVPKSLDRPQAHFFQQLPQPSLRHQSKSGTEERPSRFDAQPPFKKKRFDHESARAVLSSTSQGEHTELKETSQCPRPEVHPLTATNGSLSTQPKSSSPTLSVFPVRSTPVSRKPRRQYDDAAINRNNRRIEEVQIKPFVPETPSIAPKYSSSYKPIQLRKDDTAEPGQLWSCDDPADFSPWRGTHTEDVFSESTIKQGFSDKIHVSQAESSSAKTNVWSSLKHKSGLQAVSSLCISVLDKRQAHGTTTAGCTFKPPPRVALTDSKREAWLRDLSNPNIPLRRLSRTIPYGIRGRALLDQLLAKNIPTARSLWLAKCVGANEIRAFKRRGASGAFAVGGETKWIKDWTANVEQFLDAIISSCSTQGWTVNLVYGVRLAIHLLAEGLLDRDQYFEWLLDAVNQCGLHALSMYLLMVRSHLSDLGRSRRLGRQLADSLLKHLYKIAHLPMSNHYNALRSEIVDIIRRFTISSPASFLRPECWHDYKCTLEPILGAPGSSLLINFQNLSKRNIHLQTLAGLKDDVEVKASWAIIKSLDSILTDYDIVRPAENLRNIADDPELLVRVCLEWSASIHRKGLARIYVTARLLQKWSEEGTDVETCILNFLADNTNCCGLQRSCLFKVIIELIRSKQFSAGRYLRWIIAHGMLRGYDQLKEFPCAVGLIFEIPSYGLPTHTFNLRQNLLRSIGVSSKDEECRVMEWRTIIQRQLHAISQEHVTSKDFDDFSSDLSRESSVVKSGVGQWIGQELMIRQGAQQASNDRPFPEVQINHDSSSQRFPNKAEFRIFLEILEVIQDFSTLADVLAHCSASRDPRLLADVTITISHYLDIFKAIGIAHKLFVCLFQQHALLHSSQPMITSLIEALIDLGESLPDCFNETRTLQTYLQQHESKFSITASSPISEHMTESLLAHDSGTVSAYTDEVEQLLSSGSSMDKRLLTDVFESIWRRFEAIRVDPLPSGFVVASLISQLAAFDRLAVHELTIRWVEKTIALPSRPRLMQIGIPLISTRVISLEQLLSQALRILQDEHRPVESGNLLLEMLDLLTADRGKVGCSISSLRYRFYTEQQRFIHDFPPLMVSILQYMLRYAHSAPIDSNAHIAKLLQDSKIVSLLRTLPDSNLPNFEGIESVFGCIVMMKNAAQTISRIMCFTGDDGEGRSTLRGKLLALWNHVGSLTLPYRRLYLQAILSETSRSGEDVANHLISIMLEKGSRSSPLENQQWVSLVAALPLEQKKTTHDKAEAELFVLISQNHEAHGTSLQKHLECLLSVIDKTGKDSHSAPSATRVITQIQEKLAQLISVQPSPEATPIIETLKSAPGELEELPTRMKLNALLRLIHIHRSAFRTPNISDSAALQLLLLLFSFNNYPILSSDTHFINVIFDLLVVLSDDISPALLSHCIKTLLDRRLPVDSRLHYIIGAQRNNEASWLYMVTPRSPGGKAARRQFPVRKWETMPDATPLMADNDTSVSLTLFGARKAVL